MLVNTICIHQHQEVCGRVLIRVIAKSNSIALFRLPQPTTKSDDQFSIRRCLVIVVDESLLTFRFVPGCTERRILVQSKAATRKLMINGKKHIFEKWILGKGLKICSKSHTFWLDNPGVTWIIMGRVSPCINLYQHDSALADIHSVLAFGASSRKNIFNLTHSLTQLWTLFSETSSASFSENFDASGCGRCSVCSRALHCKENQASGIFLESCTC